MEPLKHRDHWRKLSEIRIVDAEILLKNDRYDAAYYLAGYSVECAFKARIIRRLEGYFPPKQSLYTHDLEKLLDASDLKAAFEKKSEEDKVFRADWNTVKDWSEGSRYDTHDQRAAEDILKSAREVVKCIKEYW